MTKAIRDTSRMRLKPSVLRIKSYVKKNKLHDISLLRHDHVHVRIRAVWERPSVDYSTSDGRAAIQQTSCRPSQYGIPFNATLL